VALKRRAGCYEEKVFQLWINSIISTFTGTLIF